MSKRDELSSLAELIRQELPALLAIYIFGSRAQGVAGRDSDLDLSVLVTSVVDPMRLWNLSQNLAQMSNSEVDLVDLRSASTVLQHQIITTGRRLWACEPEASVFEVFVLGEKLALDAARAGLMQDIARRGRVHAR